MALTGAGQWQWLRLGPVRQRSRDGEFLGSMVWGRVGYTC